MNVVLLSSKPKCTDIYQIDLCHRQMQAQLVLLGVEHHVTHKFCGWDAERAFLATYRTDHELVQLKRLAAAHKQDAILVLDNVRVLPEGTIAQGGVECYTRPSDGYYHGEHSEQLVTFHRSRPEGDCTLLPAALGGLYITIDRS
jgi:hypothetical protein